MAIILKWEAPHFDTIFSCSKLFSSFHFSHYSDDRLMCNILTWDLFSVRNTFSDHVSTLIDRIRLDENELFACLGSDLQERYL